MRCSAQQFANVGSIWLPCERIRVKVERATVLYVVKQSAKFEGTRIFAQYRRTTIVISQIYISRYTVMIDMYECLTAL